MNQTWRDVVIGAMESDDPHVRGRATRLMRRAKLSLGSKNSIKAAISHGLYKRNRFDIYDQCMRFVDRA